MMVEGATDRRFYSWFLRESGLSENIHVYELDSRALIPEELVSPVHAENNVRGRLVALAFEADTWGGANKGLTCIIDSDFDIVEKAVFPPQLLATDVPALETYALRERPFSKFLNQFVDEKVEANDVLRVLAPIWLHLFVLRWVLHRHSDGHGLVDNYAKKCFDKNGNAAIDVNELIRASTHAGKDEVDRLSALVSETLERMPEPSLATIRGHDIAPVLRHYFNLKTDKDELENLLRACMEFADVQDEQVFKRLVQRVSIP
ncbi:hypothetical protein IFT72_15095 [Frigoribacterium sp. CFBP 8754]|uniref:hypothetical protein n=1 Tax=Frigoribacterium sp. CFBP 8754 TaxID=2775290 RepID=UPI00177CCBDB|nr:hypothetical protein [Frigoribacterium sp. CFBP 8754]MBD8661514.1 hypothetical protein [Frigoribacterium sp. CFBP 8754]